MRCSMTPQPARLTSLLTGASSVRAKGVGTAVAFGRTGAVLTGYVGSWAIGYGGTESFFGVIALAMVSTFVALALVRRHVPAGR